MLNKKYFAAALAVGLAASALTGQVAFANKAPTKAPVANATHYSDLSGSVAVDDGFGTITPGSVSGDLSLEVDQTFVNNPIVHANLNLPSGFTWNSADVYIISDEDLAPMVSQGTVSYSNGTLSVRDLYLTDTDSDGAVEFTLLAENAEISTTVTTEGDFSVSSQYRTNANRKTKEQTWVVSTADAISLSSGPSCDFTPASPLTVGLNSPLTGEGYTDYDLTPESNGVPIDEVEGFNSDCIDLTSISLSFFETGDADWTVFSTDHLFAGEIAALVTEGPGIILLKIFGENTEADFFAAAGLKIEFDYGTQTFTFISGQSPAVTP